MPPTPSALDGVRLKIKWAKHRVTDFDRVHELFRNANKGFVARTVDPKSGKPVNYLTRDPLIPDEAALVAGDVMHSLRSALDHLAVALCVKPGRVLKAGTIGQIYFPIADDSASYKAKLGGQIKSLMKPEAIKALGAVEAYKGGKGHLLWELNQLNITDKHRLLLTVALQLLLDVGTYSLDMIRMQDPDLARDLVGVSMPLFFGVSNPAPLKAGYVLWEGLPDGEVQPEMNFGFPIAVDEPNIGPPKALVPLLLEMADHISGILPAFEQCIWQ